ncbi:DM13 domain-containing protein [Actinocorallia aurantiaca]|uniref:DM13 domain-containing protein n=1 Tax=Actinocorallia aurantiaca TaxID=46204 RepID=A0ABP6H575_9ACTN
MTRRGWAAVVAAAGVLALVAALAAFQPWKLWVDQSVQEADLPAASGPAAPDRREGGPEKVFEGSAWRSYSHGETTGKVKVYRRPDGSHAVRLEDLSTSNGPDVKVVLSPKPFDGVGDLGADHLSLGALKGNRGSSNYEIPAGTDLSRYRSAVIWCERFDAVFAASAIS